MLFYKKTAVPGRLEDVKSRQLTINYCPIPLNRLPAAFPFAIPHQYPARLPDHEFAPPPWRRMGGHLGENGAAGVMIMCTKSNEAENKCDDRTCPARLLQKKW